VGDLRKDARRTVPRQRKVVAVVDDDASMRVGLERLLQARGFDTEIFASAEAFLGAASAADCLLLDIHLDGMGGFELRRRLSSAGSRLPVIFMTAFDDEATRDEATRLGCIAYLRKPFAGHLLMEAIADATT
jgi:FixJ family two-component response regulator